MDLEKHAPPPNAQTVQQPPAQAADIAPNATFIPVAPGDILHSNNVNHAELAAGMASSPDLQQMGFTKEQMQAIANFSVGNLLCQLKAKSLAVPAPAPEPAAKQAEDLQTVNMQAEAETKRKAEEVDGSLTDEDSEDEELRDADAMNSGDSNKPIEGKARISREEKKERKAKGLNGKGAPKGTTSVQRTA